MREARHGRHTPKASASTALSRNVGKRESAIFAAGYFWGIEAVFAHVKGVTSPVSGYSGATRNSHL